MGDPQLSELPGREARALQQRTRLRRHHDDTETGLVCVADRAERRPDAAGAEEAGVAVGQDDRFGLEELECELRHRAARLFVLCLDGQRFVDHPLRDADRSRGERDRATLREDALDPPREVHRRRARRGKDPAGLLGAFENRLGVGRRRVNRRLRDAHRARDTQRRRASYAQRADRFRDRVGVDERPVFQSARQRGLVDDDDVSVAPLDRSHKRRV